MGGATNPTNCKLPSSLPLLSSWRDNRNSVVSKVKKKKRQQQLHERGSGGVGVNVAARLSLKDDGGSNSMIFIPEINMDMMSVVWLLASAGVVVAFMVYHMFSGQHYKHLEDMLANMCDERARMLQQQFSVSMNHVHALAILVSTFHIGKQPSLLDQKTFAEYTARTAFERPLMRGVAYAQKVLHSEREEFEREQGWRIKHMYTKDLSPLQDEYAPTVFSQETISYLVSLDLMSGQEDRENILRARASGKGVLTSPFRLLESNHLGVVLTFVVYNKDLPPDATADERTEAATGYIELMMEHWNTDQFGRWYVVFSSFAYDSHNYFESYLSPVIVITEMNSPSPREKVKNKCYASVMSSYLGGAFDVETFIENLLSQLAKNEAIIVNVYDITNNSDPLIMYGPDATESRFSHVSSLDFGDPYRKHEMRCRLAREPRPPKSALGFASGVLALVALICSMVYNAHTHVEKVEEDYRKMEELKVQAEAADIAKSQFLATVSHEIRTPMNGVLGMLQLLMDTELNATQQDYARTAQASGKALITLINEVLDQAKIESGRIELEAVPFDLRAILDDILSLFSGKIRDEGIELAVYVSERVPQILIGDPGRFRQIITNLVGNSVKFTEKGHIFVCIHLCEDIETMRLAIGEAVSKEASEERKGGFGYNTLSGFPAANGRSSWEAFKFLLATEASLKLRDLNGVDNNPEAVNTGDVKIFVSVEDTGVGIPRNAQGRIFMPFMQADSSTSRTYGGTGIGLSISRCLVELMEGEMEVESKESVGSTFAFTLVLRKCPKKVPPESPKQRSSDPLPVGFQGMSALVIDGQPVRSQVTKYHLQRLGIRVNAVNDRNVAIAQALSSLASPKPIHSAMEKVDMVIVDKDAWGAGSGLTFPQLLKERGGLRFHKMPKVILLATSMNAKECEVAKEMGYEDTVIMKPLRASMAAACLQQALGFGIRGGNQNQEGKGLVPEEPANLRNLLFRKWILIVDDNKVNRRVAAGALKKYGANVECAESGRVAIAMLHPPHKFDACFMDIQMPEMDGFEATKQIRRLEEVGNEPQGGDGERRRWRHLPILAMTADVIQATHEKCILSGMDGYVSKPFEEEKLYKAVATFFNP